MLQGAALIAAVVVLLISLLTHKFQRATLAVANLRTEGKGSRSEIARLQMAMSPDWVGHVALFEYVLAVVAATLIYFAFSWWILIGFGVAYLGLFAGIGVAFIPLMPHSWNLASIEKHLNSVCLSSALGQRLPIGATTDVSELLSLTSLVGDLREDLLAGKVSVESIAAGYIK